jgi:hypothetical protein
MLLILTAFFAQNRETIGREVSYALDELRLTNAFDSDERNFKNRPQSGRVYSPDQGERQRLRQSHPGFRSEKENRRTYQRA